MSQSSNSSHSLIIKNTLYLYVRMALTMVISLYTSRVVLQALGFVDYGIYALVGGIVALIAFMQSSLSGATTRFLNFEMGKKNFHNVKKVFDSSLLIHGIVCLAVIVIGETIVLWFFNHKLNIPVDRNSAAQVVFQLSLVAIAVTILRTPYDAIIIANQRMSVFAVISIFESLLKLLVALLVKYLNYDKLVLYAVLVLLSNFIVAGIYWWYCKRSFEACRGAFDVTNNYLKQIGSFFGWDLYGNMAVAIKNQGIQIIQNMFFGTVINAATGIANTASGIVSAFTANFTLAMKPQIFHYYAEGNIEKMQSLVFLSSRFSYFLMILVSLPLFIEADFFLKLWLANVPQYTAIFCQLILIQICLFSIFRPLNDAIHATGKITGLSFIGGTLLIISVLVSYLILKVKPNPTYIFIVNIIFSLLAGITNTFIVKNLIHDFSLKAYILEIVLKNILLTILVVLPLLGIKMILGDSFIYSLLIIIICLICTCSIYFVLGTNYQEKGNIRLLLQGFKGKISR